MYGDVYLVGILGEILAHAHPEALVPYPVIEHPDDGGPLVVGDLVKYLVHLTGSAHRHLTPSGTCQQKTKNIFKNFPLNYEFTNHNRMAAG